jgi:type II secretory pathway component PulL
MQTSIFLDFRENELCAYIFKTNGNRHDVQEVRRYPVSDKYDFTLDINTAGVENAYVSLPVHSLNFRVLELPFSDKDKIREVLPFELDGIILGGADGVIFDDAVAVTADSKRILAVYIEKKEIRQLLAKLTSYGLDPVYITSLELRTILRDFTPEKLLAPVVVDDQERLKLAAEEMKAPVINLRRDEFAFTREIEKTRKSLRVTAVLFMVLALVLSVNLVFQIISVRNETASVKNDMRKQYQEMFPGEKNIMNELYQLKSHMKELKDKEDVFVGVKPLDLILKLSGVERQSVVFNEISEDKGNITLKGEAPSLSDVQKVKGSLESLFPEITISDSKSSAQGRMLFSITAKEKKS